MTPRSEAIAFRAWQVASRMEWNCTIAEVAEEIGCDYRRLGNVMAEKGWTSRFRTTLKSGLVGMNNTSGLNGGNLGSEARFSAVQALSELRRFGKLEVDAL